MCLSLCSSPAVQGVFVLPRFLPLSSVSSVGIGTEVLVSPIAEPATDGSVVPGGKVSSFGLREDRRLRGLLGVVGRAAASVLGFGARGAAAIGTSAGTSEDDVVAAECLCRLNGGGDLLIKSGKRVSGARQS